MTPLSLAASFIFWQLTYLLCSLFTPSLLRLLTTDKALRHTLRQQLPPYLVSTLHAFIVTARGLRHLYVLRTAPAALKLAAPPAALASSYTTAALAEVDHVLVTNVLLAGYLLCDMLHVARMYPTVGGADTLLHHLAFAGCAIVAGAHTLYPFMFGWLIVGEASTPLLNARWLMIRLGYGGSKAFPVVEKAFAGMFVFTRFFVYLAGLVHQFWILQEAGTPKHIPAWARWTAMGFVVAGFLLNLVWLKKIWTLATGRGKHARAERAAAD